MIFRNGSLRKFLKKAIQNVSLIFVALVLSVQVFAADTGIIQGNVVSKTNGEPLVGVNIIVQGPTQGGTATDINGFFSVDRLAAGSYTVNATYIGYGKKVIKDVVVEEGQTVKLNFTMSPTSLQGEEVIVTAKALKNTEAVLLKDRQKAQTLSDAISSEGMSKAGLGTAAEAMKKITGASVIGGKYVYVRGLGDRYTSTSLNGAEIPSADPYTRSGTIDIVPSNLIDNVVTKKSFTPDKPGNFSGGNVNIRTKDFPDRFNMSFSSSFSYNSNKTFKDGLRITNLGKSHLLGVDGGSLDIPSFVPDSFRYIDRLEARTNEEEADFLENYSDAFTHKMAPQSKNVPINQKYSFSIGNQTQLFGKTLGYIASAMYSRKFGGYDDGTYARWMLKSTAESASSLENMFKLNDNKTTDEVLWGVNLKTSYKFSPQNIVSLTTLYNQNGIGTGRTFMGSFPYDLKEDELYVVSSQQYQERKLSSYQLEGNHQLNLLNNTKLKWQTTYANSHQNEPDLRYLTYSMQPGANDTTYNVRSNIPQERYFRDLTENRLEGNYNFTIPLNQYDKKAKKLKFGSSFAYKDRDFDERRFIYEPPEDIGTKMNQNSGDLNDVFTDENMGIIGSDVKPNGRTYYDVGIYIKETNQKKYNYTGKQFINAHYAMADLFLTERLRLITGVRYEQTDMEVASDDTTQPVGDVTTEDFLPSLNIIYSLADNMNLRAAYGKTLARPSFREISPLVSYDFKEGDKFIGNSELERTLIDNYDLRLEWFNAPGQLLAVSGFYKNFDNPIEKVIKDINYWQSWVNVDNAKSYGVEIELRQKLSFISSSLENFSINTNASLIHSEVKRDSLELANKRRINPEIAATRPFQGQSPYLFNFTLSYENNKKRLSSTLYFNVFGERLAAIGKSGTPDIYEQPANTLNFSISKGLTKNINLKLSVNNILDSKDKEVYTFKEEDYTSKLHRKGRSISLGLKYSL